MTDRPTRERLYFDAHGPDDDALKLGVGWLVRYASQHVPTRAGLFVPTLQQVEHLAPVLGTRGAAALKKDRRVRVNGVDIELLIERGLSAVFPHGPVLAIWADDRQLDKLEKLGAPALCAIPWNRADIDDWRLNFNPVNLRTGASAGSDETVTNKVVVEALKSLTTRVNLSSGLGHPSDKAAAVQLFKVLKAGGEVFDANEVRAWAARNGWGADHARQLGELAQKITTAARCARSRNKHGVKTFWTMWRSEAGKP